jgi:hypothetical protein
MTVTLSKLQRRQCRFQPQKLDYLLYTSFVYIVYQLQQLGLLLGLQHQRTQSINQSNQSMKSINQCYTCSDEAHAQASHSQQPVLLSTR